ARLVDSLQHDQKLFAAEAKQLIAPPQRALHDLADQQQHFIAEQVSVSIVDGFEVIDIEQTEPAGQLRCAGCITRGARTVAEFLKARLEGLAVQQARQRITLSV